MADKAPNNNELFEIIFLDNSETPGTSETCDKFFEKRERVDALLDLYKKHKPKVGTMQCKSMKKLWEIVSIDISNLFKITVSAQKCENKFKVLERAYKKIIDNDNKTGRGRKCFEFQSKMDEIFHKKTNIRPITLLSNNIIRKPAKNKIEEDRLIPHEEVEVVLSMPEEEVSESAQVEVSITTKGNVPSETQKPQFRGIRTKPRPTPTYIKRNDILCEIKNDLRNYYKEKLKIDKEKLEVSRRKLEEQVKKNAHLEKFAEVFNQTVQNS